MSNITTTTNPNNLQMTLAGRSFFASAGSNTGTGITIPIYSTTTGVSFALWNPLGSNRILDLKVLTIGVAATATPAITTLALGVLLNTGGSAGAGLPISGWTDGVVYNGRFSKSTGQNVGRIGVATSNLSSATTEFYNLGISQATTSLAGGLVTLTYRFDDCLALDPGTMVHLVGTPLAPVETAVVSLGWIEQDFVS